MQLCIEPVKVSLIAIVIKYNYAIFTDQIVILYSKSKVALSRNFTLFKTANFPSATSKLFHGCSQKARSAICGIQTYQPHGRSGTVYQRLVIKSSTAKNRKFLLLVTKMLDCSLFNCFRRKQRFLPRNGNFSPKTAFFAQKHSFWANY